MKYFLIMNPMSGGGESRRKFHRIFTLLEKYNVDYSFIVTKSIENALFHSRKANESNCECIVAVGGDGTINSVINGFFDDTGNRISDAKMGVIYTGTSPDFCKSYQIPLKLEKAIKTLKESKTTPARIGKVTYCVDPPHNQCSDNIETSCLVKTNFFACCLNAGLGASLARQANSGIRKYLGDKMGTFISLLKVLSAYRSSSFTTVRDNIKETTDSLFNLSVGITPFIASGIKVNHRTPGNEGKFYCLAASNLKLNNLPNLLYKIYSGREIKDTYYLNLEYCKTIEILGNNICPEIEFDGDPHGYLPCKIEMANSCIDLITGTLK
jgi:diacylglycerol kinase (ATP)